MENKVEEIIINNDDDRRIRPSLPLVQTLIVLIAVVVFVLSKSFLPDIYERLKYEYEVRLYDSVYAQLEDREGLIELERA